MQQARDLMKEALCARRGVRVVTIAQDDLTLNGMLQKIGTLLPLRDLSDHAELAKFLQKASKRYRS